MPHWAEGINYLRNKYLLETQRLTILAKAADKNSQTFFNICNVPCAIIFNVFSSYERRSTNIKGKYMQKRITETKCTVLSGNGRVRFQSIYRQKYKQAFTNSAH